MTTPEGNTTQQPDPAAVAAAAAAAAGGQQQNGGQQGSGKGQGGGQQQQPDDTPKFTQADYNRFEAQVRREYASKAEKDKALIEKGKEYEALLQESKPLTEQVQTLSGSVAERDGKIAELEAAALRQRLAWEAGLPPAIGRRVTGNTEDEIKADIEDLKKDLAPAQGQGQGSGLRPNPQQGAPSPENNRTGSVSGGRDLWAQKHGKKVDAAS